jgi:excisionase family DNA binding protein
MKLLRAAQVAEMLDVPRARAYEMMRDGLLPSVRLGRAVRVDPERLRDWLAHGGTPSCSGVSEHKERTPTADNAA